METVTTPTHWPPLLINCKHGSIEEGNPFHLNTPSIYFVCLLPGFRGKPFQSLNKWSSINLPSNQSKFQATAIQTNPLTIHTSPQHLHIPSTHQLITGPFRGLVKEANKIPFEPPLVLGQTSLLYCLSIHGTRNAKFSLKGPALEDNHYSKSIQGKSHAAKSGKRNHFPRK